MNRQQFTIIGYTEGTSFDFEHCIHHDNGVELATYWVEFAYTDSKADQSNGDITLRSNEGYYLHVGAPKKLGSTPGYAVTPDGFARLHDAIAQKVMELYLGRFTVHF